MTLVHSLTISLAHATTPSLFISHPLSYFTQRLPQASAGPLLLNSQILQDIRSAMQNHGDIVQFPTLVLTEEILNLFLTETEQNGSIEKLAKRLDHPRGLNLTVLASVLALGKCLIDCTPIEVRRGCCFRLGAQVKF